MVSLEGINCCGSTFRSSFFLKFFGFLIHFVLDFENFYWRANFEQFQRIILSKFEDFLSEASIFYLIKPFDFF